VENDRYVKSTFTDTGGIQVEELILTFQDNDPGELFSKLINSY
jgi:hypothetical protein